MKKNEKNEKKENNSPAKSFKHQEKSHSLGDAEEIRKGLTISRYHHRSVSKQLKLEKEMENDPKAQVVYARKVLRDKFKKLTAEYERRIITLTEALDEKAGHHVELARQAKRNEVTTKELKKNEVDLEQDKLRLENENKKKK